MTMWGLRECEGLTARASQQQTNSAKLEDDLRAEVERMIQDTLDNFVCSISRGRWSSNRELMTTHYYFLSS